MTCPAKIRPFPDDTELACEDPHDRYAAHQATLRDYAYPGSETVVHWHDDDRRNFIGDWAPCTGLAAACILPAGHRGRHEQ